MVRHEIDVSRHQLMRNGIEVVNAEASFEDPHTLRLRYPDGRGESVVNADKVVIAVGTEAVPDPRMPLDGCSILSSDDILRLQAAAAQPGGDRRRRDRLRICQHVRARSTCG